LKSLVAQSIRVAVQDERVRHRVADEDMRRAGPKMGMTAYVIQTEDLAKKYGENEAVKRLTLNVRAGSVNGFLGQNGSGKTTTLKMLMGAIRPSSGSGRVLDFSIDDPEQSVEIRKRVAFVSEDKQLYDYMTVAQIIRFTKSFFPNWRADLEQKYLDQFPLPLDRRIKKLSKGMRTQLALLLGIARGSQMLVLDEPTEGLDPVAIEAFLQFLRDLAAEGITVFFSSHHIAEVEQIADHILVIDRGELLVNSPIESLKNQNRVLEAVLQTPVPTPEFATPGVKSVRMNGKTVSVLASHNLENIAERLRTLGATDISVRPANLKEIYLHTLKTR
jgi:ABC-2 type transport system ATP-binding protein